MHKSLLFALSFLLAAGFNAIRARGADVRPEAGSIAESIPPISFCPAADVSSYSNIRTGEILNDGRTTPTHG